ncbi:MAG: hypothetical protein ACLRIL_07945 [Fusicatenibacter saccharivorans]
MKAYIELTSVPIARENTPLLASAAELAERPACQGGEAVELRLQKEADAIHCYMGVSSLSCAKTLRFAVEAATLRLSLSGAKLSEMSTETLAVARCVRNISHIIPGQNRGSTLLMREIVPDAGRQQKLVLYAWPDA